MTDNAEADKQTKIDTNSLTRSTGRGALWQVIGGGWATLVRLGASTVLARVLDPRDFGIMGMAILARELVLHMGQMGMGAGIIAKKDATEDDLNTCFWSMAAVRILMFLLAFAGAPLAAHFFQTPQVTMVFRVVSVTFLFTIMTSVSNVLLQKELKYLDLNVIRGIGILIESSLAIFLALNWRSDYWALVYSLLVGTFFMEFAIFLWARWYPKLRFNKESFNYLFRFGINIQGFSIVNYVNQNIDYLLVGRLLGSASLGLYEFAYRIPHLMQERVARPVAAVVFPALSQVQDSNEHIIAGYCKSAKYIALGVFPALGGLAVLAEPTVLVLWGEKWLPIVVPLQILCACAAIRCIMAPIGSVFNCKHRPDIPFKFSLVRLIFTFISVGILGHYYGLIGVACGMLLSTAPSYIILLIAFKLTESKMNIFYKYLNAPFNATVTMIFVTYILNKTLIIFNFSIFVQLNLGITTGIVVYIMFLYFFQVETKKEIISTIKTIKF